jgi:ribose transport system ATP-binding protein
MLNVLEAKNIRKSFGGVQALKCADFVLKRASVCGLVGANGSGKTTFAKIVSGLLLPDGGELIINGINVSLRTRVSPGTFGLAMVHQNLSLIPEMTILENITLGVEKVKRSGFIDKYSDRDKVKDIISSLNLKLPLDMIIEDLSPSEKQLVEFAKAIFRDPKILLLDEATASLEFNEVEKIFEIINDLKSKGVSIVFISHRLWEVTKICDELVAFRNGETVGTVNFEKQERNERLVIPLITGKEDNLEEIKKEKKVDNIKIEELSLEIEKLSRGKKVQNISFKVRKGEILGLGGLNGQGQEELLLMLAGFLKKSSGKIKINGKYVNVGHPKDTIKYNMFLVPGDRQTEGLFMRHSIMDNIILPKVTQRNHSFILNINALKKEAEEIIKKVSIMPPDKDIIVSNLSGGNQQKVVVGKWLNLSPKILLLADPAKGVDIETRTNIYKIIYELTKSGTSVILYASDNEELIYNCDRVLIMFEGQIVDELIGDKINDKNLLASSMRIN